MGELIAKSKVAVLVWAGLMIATLLSWFLGIEEGGDANDAASIGAIAAIVIAFVKIRFVGHHFMELRAAPLALRAIFDGYVVVICTALVVICFATG